ncbi:MAG TPA: MBL fold metallo-hydrolase [Candidatus Acidoferrales bacterium]|jgi:cyclase|nr:MBL fold metallo-hydrolase [Candidatus Acidoferrales bacterium]
MRTLAKQAFGSSKNRALMILLAAAALAGTAASVSAQATTAAPGQRNPTDVEVHVLPVRGNVYMLIGAGGNITVQAGDDGVLLVDAGLAGTSDAVDAAIRSISTKPIRYIIDTHVHADHVGGNEALAKLGNTIAGGNVVGDIGASAGNQATVIAAQEVLDRMSSANGTQPAMPQGAWPTETYTTPERKLYFNGEGVLMIHPQAAHTDGDTIVFFRRSDVISTGDIFVTTGYPIVDLSRGGNIQGVIAGLNRIIDLAIPADEQEGGTLIIPGHGRLCDVADVVFYQEMVTIIRDRIQDMVNKGMTLDQVKAAKPTLDYDPRYGKDTGFWTTDMFVEAVFKSLSPKK